MGTLTAYNKRDNVLEVQTVQINLVPALPEDFKQIESQKDNGTPVFKLRIGMIYWLKSLQSGDIEPQPRRVTADDDLNEIKFWLDNKMIYVAKCLF